jgi:hypothetical protein
MRLSAPSLSKARLEQLLNDFLPDSRQHETGSGMRSKEEAKEIYEEGSPSGSNSQ